MLIADAKAFEVSLLFNNKEAISRELTSQKKTEIERWKKTLSLSDDELRKQSVKTLKVTFDEMERLDTTCDLGLLEKINIEGKKNNILRDERDLTNFIAYLRNADLIDDILYKLLRDSAVLKEDFRINAKEMPERPFNLYSRNTSTADVEKLYAPFKQWPDDSKRCTLDTYVNMVQTLTWKNSKDRDAQIQRLNYIAQSNKVIDLETYNRLESLRLFKVMDWPVFFKRYADIINNSKDKLSKVRETKSSNKFTVEYVSRKEKITKRANLYSTYNSTQVMMMAQIIEKTAKRMDARKVTLNWQYTDDLSSEIETYIFSPMEQYRAAIKMLRKDMAEVMRSDAFRGTGFEYSHLIAAAFESGFIKTEELDYVLKFEDFWNPKVPKWKAYSDFAFGLAGSASFYLPPPWNILGAIGLVLTQSKVNGEPEPDPEDNWNSVL
jgi:uncharacterized protein YeaO (DUF488 family)